MCNRDAYNSSVDVFKPCPYCGILFSGKHGMDRRREARVQKEIPFVLTHKGQFLEASTINISEGGLCVKIHGGIPFSLGDVLNLHLNGSGFRARIAWAYSYPDESTTVMGLQVTDGNFGIS